MTFSTFAPDAEASRSRLRTRSNACSTVGIPFSRFTTTTRSTVFGKFSTDCEASQKRQVNACAGIGFPQVSQSLDLCIPAKFRQTPIISKNVIIGSQIRSEEFKTSHKRSNAVK
jgi:hypothetical protein